MRNICGQDIALSKEEWNYYLELKNVYGEAAFENMFVTDEQGFIISVNPSPTNPSLLGVVFFLLNLSFNQRVRRYESKISLLEARLKAVEDRVTGASSETK